MISQLGSMPFCQEYLQKDSVGHWVIEKDPGKEPRMYADDVMLSLIGVDKEISPEENYRAFVAGIDRNYLDSVMETERLNIQGMRAAVRYPWHYPDGRTILVLCEGVRNFGYTQGIRTEGRHRNITGLTFLQKENAVITALTADFECVGYVVLRENKMEDFVVPFRISPRLKELIPGWEEEASFSKRLRLLVEYIGYGTEADIRRFYHQTRREVILRNLKRESAYYVNARAIVDKGKVEYFQIKFTADRNEQGDIVGFVIGIHSVDDEMRQEIKMRKEVEQQVEKATAELEQKNAALAKVNEHIISMIGEIVEWRDEESGEHVGRVAYLTRILGLQVMEDLPEYKLSVRDVAAIAAMSPLHDLGKIKIPDSILLKPGKLTPEEFDLMKSHCERGCELLEKLAVGWHEDLRRFSMDICMYHHEKWDGKGYPCGLKGDEIPIAAQIVGIADCYDALINERYYKPAYSHEEAYNMIMTGKCGVFSEKLLGCLTRCRKAFAASSSLLKQNEGEGKGRALWHADQGEQLLSAVPIIEEISQSLPGGFFIYQADGEEKFIYFNDMMVKYFGCSSREEFIELTGNSFKGIVHPEDYPGVEREIFEQVARNDNNLDHVIYRFTRKDGEVRWLNDYGRLIRSNDMGDVFFVFVTELS